MTDLISREAVCKIVADRVTDKFEKKAACHGIRALPAAQVKVKPLVWEDFDGLGAKASAFYQANYLIQWWKGEGRYEVALSYPGYQTGYDGQRWHDTLDAAKAAAQADYETRILAALELSPTAADASQTPDPVLSDPRVKALVEQVRALIAAADGESYATYCGALEATDAALQALREKPNAKV